MKYRMRTESLAFIVSGGMAGYLTMEKLPTPYVVHLFQWQAGVRI